MPSINLIARDNGVGLSRDLELLATRLSAHGLDVTVTGVHGGKLTKLLRPPFKRLQWKLRRPARARYDINLMLEHIWPDDLPFARSNVLMPNPEWFLPRDRRHLDSIDLILAKTRHAEGVFGKLGARVVYTGFAGRDRFDPEPVRQKAFFHLAGRSNLKGTRRLLALWRRHPEWPLLTVVQNPRTAQPGAPAPNIDHRIGYLDDAELRRLQNTHRFHLCPSEAEGFGHYLAEAMTVGALTITVDAAPMNELIAPAHGLLLRASCSGEKHLATTHQFDECALEQAVEQVMALDDATLERMGSAARNCHRRHEDAFDTRLIQALLPLCRNSVATPVKPGRPALASMQSIRAQTVRIRPADTNAIAAREAKRVNGVHS